MTCTHSVKKLENHGWECERSGEWCDDWRQVEHSTQEDIDLHRFRCSQCGEVGYYSNAARAFHERGEERPDLGLTKIDAAPAAPVAQEQAQGEPVAWRVRARFRAQPGFGPWRYFGEGTTAPYTQDDCDPEPLYLHPPRADAEIVPIGPREPDMTLVICPACTAQFRAIPVEVQEEIARLRAALTGLLDHYVALANSGDAGNRNPEEEPQVIAARRALQGE